MIRIARLKARSLAIVALPVVAVAITVPTVAMAVDPPSPNEFKGCLTAAGELFNVQLNPAEALDCNRVLEADGTEISWNQTGVQGAQGATGAAGAAGTAGVAGAAGAVGLTGPAGAAGKNGVSGYKMVAAKGKAAARTAATYTVMCKDGRVALGGGMNGTSDLILNGSGPTADAKGWTVRVTNVATKARTVRVYVTCALATS